MSMACSASAGNSRCWSMSPRNAGSTADSIHPWVAGLALRHIAVYNSTILSVAKGSAGGRSNKGGHRAFNVRSWRPHASSAHHIEVAASAGGIGAASVTEPGPKVSHCCMYHICAMSCLMTGDLTCIIWSNWFGNKMFCDLRPHPVAGRSFQGTTTSAACQAQSLHQNPATEYQAVLLVGQLQRQPGR